MQVKIRYAKTEDFSQLKDIWLRCFNDSKEFIDLFFSYKGYWKAIVIEHNNTIVSMLFVIPTADDFWYIYAVATLPQYRKQGLMKKLLNETYLRSIKHRKKGILLVPATEMIKKYYEKLGFVSFSKLKKVILIPRSQQFDIIENKITESQINTIRKKYFKESIKWKSKHVALSKLTTLVFGGDIIAFKYKKDQGYVVVENQKHLIVKEIAFSSNVITMEVLQEITNFLSKRFSKTNEVIFHLIENSPIKGELFSFAMIKSNDLVSSKYFNLALD